MRSRHTRATVLMGFALLIFSGRDAAAKSIVEGAEPSSNRVYIRTDGLACYFCAYGLERFFKKTGRIAAFDMNMEEGLVELIPLRDEPLVTARDLRQYVHDAGFTPRWFRVELTGRFERASDALVFVVAETEQRLPMRASAVAAVAAEDLGRLVRLRARAGEHDEAAFELEEVAYELTGDTGTEGHP